MRAIPEALAATLAGEATTLAHVWRVTRTDGRAFAFTDHDRALPFDDLVAEPAQGIGAGAAEKGFDLAPDSASLTGAFSSAALDVDDLARGLWDGARADLFLVDWRTPSLRAHLFAGTLGEVRREGAAFATEVRGLKDRLDAPAGRVFSRRCDAEVGDGRCGVNLAQGAYRGAGTVVALTDERTLRCSGLSGFAEGWFARGRISFADGAAVEVAAHRRDGAEALLELSRAIPVAPGAAFTLTAGCDKRHATCRDKFMNVINFRGFPHMPGPDALLEVAPEGAAGGSRGEAAR